MTSAKGGATGIAKSPVVITPTFVPIPKLLATNKAKDIAKQLKTDKFYNLCVETTQKRFEMYYSEKVFVDNWKRIWND